ncbi:hypothetical protein [Alcaligenes faecalis]|uniref:hypothetical protein n=1 Tax=Alcaligenes faecalis TaxID=511 RepID=UPI00214FF63A|nr:hypothetical protein [Alcaligenes faecalis]MCR4143976.1 hypothetical protein [Alcaligenes faecalis]
MCDKKLTENQIKEMVSARLTEYEDMSLLEQYAMFMGKAQVLEFGLKGLLHRRYNVPFEKMEHLTLGQAKTELERKALRPDFIAYLQRVVKHRNDMAHAFLLNLAITKSLADFSDRKLFGDLFRASYELEQIMIFYDWCEENNCW